MWQMEDKHALPFPALARGTDRLRAGPAAATTASADPDSSSDPGSRATTDHRAGTAHCGARGPESTPAASEPAAAADPTAGATETGAAETACAAAGAAEATATGPASESTRPTQVSNHMSPDNAIIVSAGNPPGGNAARGRLPKYRGPVLPVQRRVDIRRNQLCPCGSGKKAKKCCLPRLRAMAAMPPVVRTQAIVASILGHWPTTEPPAPIPAAVQQRFKNLVAQQTEKAAPEPPPEPAAPMPASVVHTTHGQIQAGDTTIDVGPGTLTLNAQPSDANT